MRYKPAVKSKKKKALLGMIALILVIGGYIGFNKFEWEKPTLNITPEPQFLGSQTVFEIVCKDLRSGVKEVMMEIVQNDLIYPVFQKTYLSKTHRIEESIVVEPKVLGLMEGAALLRTKVQDYSWKPGGNRKTADAEVIVDTRPPNISVLTRFHYINQGGSGLVIYHASEKLSNTGVNVGDTWFPGYHVENKRFLCFFAVPFDATDQTAVALVSDDLAGNRTHTHFPYRIKPKRFRKDTLYITDGFLSKVMPYFTDRDPSLTGDLIDVFLKVNRDLRRANAEAVLELNRQSTGEILWSGPFLRLHNAKTMAHFADRRDYIHKGKKIDLQYHLGVDLASLAMSSVKAANKGKVVFADEMGIYGNTIILDHGIGLFSMYGHLSQIDVQLGQIVEKGTHLGTTGTTGLAGGDHLHFSILISGVFVNPIEWWDPHWVKDNVDQKLALLKSPVN